MRLSLLDRSRTRAGRPEAESVTGTVARAVHAEALGYDRFWVAEHHGVPGIGSGSPTVLLAAIGARTSTVRIGTGGVMLPHHQPLVVAEQALLLDALHPGRVDLGLGRSLGFTPPVRRALRHHLDDPDTFEDDLVELRSYLEATAGITAHPASERVVPMHVLATGRGLALAARLGLPGGRGRARAGRRGGRRPARDLPPGVPSARGSAPWVTVSLDVLVADDDATGRELALPEAWAMARVPPDRGVRTARERGRDPGRHLGPPGALAGRGVPGPVARGQPGDGASRPGAAGRADRGRRADGEHVDVRPGRVAGLRLGAARPGGVRAATRREETAVTPSW